MVEPNGIASSGSLGAIVDSISVERPRHTTLTGKIVSIVPLDAEAHTSALYEGSHGAESERLWLYMSDGPYPDFASFKKNLAQKAASNDPLFFTIVDNASGEAVGFAAYLRIEPIHRVIEVGNIMYTPALRQTAGATEAMYLMAQHVFEDLRYRRYEWKCNALHAGSRRAALRLGFTFEGLFRQHMIIKGCNRDTTWFSMLDSEWPARKAALEGWLRPSNFDRDGKQIEALTVLHATMQEQSGT